MNNKATYFDLKELEFKYICYYLIENRQYTWAITIAAAI